MPHEEPVCMSSAERRPRDWRCEPALHWIAFGRWTLGRQRAPFRDQKQRSLGHPGEAAPADPSCPCRPCRSDTYRERRAPHRWPSPCDSAPWLCPRRQSETWPRALPVRSAAGTVKQLVSRALTRAAEHFAHSRESAISLRWRGWG